MRIPTHSNCVINSETGDGFQNILPTLVSKGDLIIVRSENGYHGRQFANTKANVVSIHKVHKLEGCLLGYRVIIAVRLPQYGTKSLKALRAICEDKHVIIAENLHDSQALSSALFILEKAKPGKLIICKFDRYQHFRLRY